MTYFYVSDYELEDRKNFIEDHNMFVFNVPEEIENLVITSRDTINRIDMDDDKPVGFPEYVIYNEIKILLPKTIRSIECQYKRYKWGPCASGTETVSDIY